MSRFASLTGGSSSGRFNPLAGSGTRSLLSGGRGFASIGSAPDENADIGKGTLDITDPVGSLFAALGSFASVAGGVLGGIGEIGVPGAQIKNLAEPLADLATKNPVSSAIGGAVGRAGGAAIEAVSGPGQSVEEIEARNRLRGAQGLGYAGNTFLDTLGDFLSGKPFDPVAAYGLSGVGTKRREGIPPDILARLEAGESVDKLAEEMTNRGQGFSSNLTVELAKGILLDPINVIGGLIPKLFGAARSAGRAIEAGSQVGRTEVLVGRTYNLVAGGLSAARAETVRRAIGPVTSGVLHHVGIDNYTGLLSRLKTTNPAYASSFDDAFAVGNGTLVRAYLGDRIGSFYRGVLSGVRKTADDIRGVLPDIETEMVGALRAAQANRGDLEKGIQELIAKVAPDFEHLDDAERAVTTAKRLSLITGQSVEDAVRTLGDDVSVGTAQLVHLAYYGRAVDNLVVARAASAGAKTNLPLDRITLISARTLDEGTARSLVEAIIEGRAGGIEDAVRQYDVLTARFLGKTHTETDVADYLKTLLDNDALPTLVKKATTRENPLPSALGDWRVKYEAESGYRLGFAPESGWKAIITGDDVIVTDPFVHLQGYREAISVRNPIGRFADSLMRGVSQEILILEGTHRAVRFAQKFKAGIAPNQTRAIFRAVLNRAANAKETPRGLSALKGTYHVLDEAGNTAVKQGNAIDEVFDRFLSPAEMTEMRKGIEPTVLMMRGLEGNFNRVGVTQKLTGRAKVIGAETGLPVAQIAEHIYPLLRFVYNPFFQLQEYLESPFWNALRGIKKEIIDPDVQEAYNLFAKETDFRLIAEAGHVTNIAGAEVAQEIAGKTTRIGRAMQPFAHLRNIQQRKNAAMVAQRFAEHGEEFESVVNRISPRIWQTMVDAYGTTDANVIARRFITERIQLARGEIDEAMKGAGIGRATGMSADEATVMEAWRESFNRASKQAFKTHFFAPERGFLERSLNHPYLGLYPLSYMWGKVVPEFARFLLLRPFGLRAPLVGYAAMQRTQQAMLSWALVPGNAKWLEDHADSIYTIELLMPGQPTDLPVNAPAWARHLVRDAKGGKEITSERVFREVGDAARTLGMKPIAGLELGVRAGGEIIGGDLLKNLERAAEQFDFWAEKPDKF